MGGLAIVEGRLSRLEKKAAIEGGFVPPDNRYEFKVAASCPPDKRLRIAGGTPKLSHLYGAALYDYSWVDARICDLENQDETQMDLIFTNANYYLGIILCYEGQWLLYHVIQPATYGEPVYDPVVGTEVETAAGAEAQIDAFMNGVEQWYYYRMPLVGVVLQNNGQTGVQYAISPIDAINRGRSYIYRDLRSLGGIFP